MSKPKKPETIGDLIVQIQKERKSMPTDLDIARKMVSKADNAEQRNIEFDLTFQDVKRLMTRKTCYYSGEVLRDGGERGGNRRTLDRINSKLGYTRENTVACTSAINRLKNRIFEELNVDIKVVKKLIKEIEASK